MFIQWIADLETRQPVLDAEHKLLVMLFRKLDVAIKSRIPEDSLSAIIQEVRRFVEFHFVSEENLMRETGFPGLDAHRDLHKALLAKLSALMLQVAAHREFPEDLLYFLNAWLIDHIGTEDQVLAEHVRSSSLRPVAEFIYPEFLASA